MNKKRKQKTQYEPTKIELAIQRLVNDWMSTSKGCAILFKYARMSGLKVPDDRLEKVPLSKWVKTFSKLRKKIPAVNTFWWLNSDTKVNSHTGYTSNKVNTKYNGWKSVVNVPNGGMNKRY